VDGGKQALYNFCSFRVSVPESEISPRQLRPQLQLHLPRQLQLLRQLQRLRSNPDPGSDRHPRGRSDNPAPRPRFVLVQATNRWL